MNKKGRPKRQSWPRCKFKDCDRSTRGGSRGFCQTHYMAFRRGRLSEDGAELRPPMRVVSYGLGARCAVPDCGNRPKGLGLCNTHLLQHHAGEDVGVEVPKRGHKRSVRSYSGSECLVLDCERRPANRGMCDKHAQQRMAGIIDEEGNTLRQFKAFRRPRKDRWVGQQGYVLVKAPKSHPHARQDGSILEHRLVMEEHLGRHLGPEEVVHHVNGVKDDNRIENLQLRESVRKHGHGHEQIEDVEQALVVLENLINKSISQGAEFKTRLQRLYRRL